MSNQTDRQTYRHTDRHTEKIYSSSVISNRQSLSLQNKSRGLVSGVGGGMNDYDALSIYLNIHVHTYRKELGGCTYKHAYMHTCIQKIQKRKKLGVR